jgi:hypothetical protein
MTNKAQIKELAELQTYLQSAEVDVIQFVHGGSPVYRKCHIVARSAYELAQSLISSGYINKKNIKLTALESIDKQINAILGQCSERSYRWRTVVLALEKLLGEIELDEPCKIREAHA